MSDTHAQANVIRLSDYTPPEFTTDHVNLAFDIDDDHTIVSSTVTYKRTEHGAEAQELVLDAEDPTPAGSPDYIRSVTADDMQLAEGQGYIYEAEHNRLRIPLDADQDEIKVEIETYLEPQHNSALSGLYESDHCVVTQCESQGFRRITPFLDRPDVMAAFDVTISAPQASYPVLLSNGNKLDSGELANGRHWARFHDPIPKPCYLFATADGQFDWIEDSYITGSGREVALYIYTDTGAAESSAWHAMYALKQSMKWDEATFGCEYDLDSYHVVAVAKFSMGAMENKGLNVFRDSLVLARPEIAEDADYQRIIDVIGHEYFHNYSGNRITNANWFNLSLKEGLTVNREQMFTAYMTSDALERISAVQVLRRAQFPEDDSPMAHPVMPPEIRAVDNIYTPTVYIKGSEIIRMMKTMMGDETFIEAVKHYFAEFDGQAVTINDFVTAMEAVSGLNFSGQFYRWYTQSGRPQVEANGEYDPGNQTYRLTFRQHNPPTQDQPEKQPMLIPVTTALIDNDGNDIPLRLQGETGDEAGYGAVERVLHFTENQQTFIFENVETEPSFHSLLRGFSAPVDFEPGLDHDQLHAQLLKDTDGLNRWDAGQKLALYEMERLYNAYIQNGEIPALDAAWLASLRKVVNDVDTDPNLVATALTLPGISELEARIKPADPQAVAAIRKHIRHGIATDLADDWQAAYDRACAATDKPYSFHYSDTGYRRLKKLALAYLTENGDRHALQQAQALYERADNMTDRAAAIAALMDHSSPERNHVLDDFYQRFRDDTLTIRKYFTFCAGSDFDGVIEELEQLTQSDVFDWQRPGHVQSLYGGFIRNYAQFHRSDGAGYHCLADGVMKQTRINGTTAAGMVEALCRWRDYTPAHQALMCNELRRIQSDLYQGLESGEIAKVDAESVLDKVEKALPGADALDQKSA
jgi:aminopeptidase N